MQNVSILVKAIQLSSAFADLDKQKGSEVTFVFGDAISILICNAIALRIYCKTVLSGDISCPKYYAASHEVDLSMVQVQVCGSIIADRFLSKRYSVFLTLHSQSTYTPPGLLVPIPTSCTLRFCIKFFIKSYLFIHSGPLIPFLDFLLIGMDYF